MKYLQLSLICLLISCQNQIKEEKIDFFKESLHYISKEPVLKIYGEFQECGEFGGHQAYINISKKNEKVFKLTYKKYSVNCDSMVNVFDGTGYLILPKRKLVLSIEMELQDKEKQALLDFSIAMVKSKFQEEFPGHSGLKLSICNADSTFLISTYGGDDKHYYELIKKLNLRQ